MILEQQYKFYEIRNDNKSATKNSWGRKEKILLATQR